MDRCSDLEIRYVTIAFLKETVAPYFPFYFVKITAIFETKNVREIAFRGMWP